MSTSWIVAVLALWTLVLLLAVLLLGTLRRLAPLLERAELAIQRSRPGGLESGATVPDFEAVDADGERLTAVDLEQRRSIVLLVDRDCPPCKQLVGEIAAADPRVLEFELFAIYGERALHSGFPSVVGVRTLVQVDGSVSRAFQSISTPHVFALDGRRVVDSGTPNTIEGLRHLALRLREEVSDQPKQENVPV